MPMAPGETGLMSKPDRAWSVYENDGPVAEATTGPIPLVGTAGSEFNGPHAGPLLYRHLCARNDRIGSYRQLWTGTYYGKQTRIRKGPCRRLGNPEHLVRLETEPPLGVREAVAHSQRRVGRALGPVHRLEEEVAEIEPGIALGLGAPLREYELELVAASHDELGVGLGADADPVDPGEDRTRADRKSTRLN